MPQNSTVFLVLAKVSLLGGGEKTEIDVIPALSPEEAANVTRNLFSQAGENNGVVFGESVFLPNSVMAVEAAVLAEIDLMLPTNHRWTKSLEAFTLFDRMADSEEDPAKSF
jgi:hypothetical protein